MNSKMNSITVEGAKKCLAFRRRSNPDYGRRFGESPDFRVIHPSDAVVDKIRITPVSTYQEEDKYGYGIEDEEAGEESSDFLRDDGSADYSNGWGNGGDYADRETDEERNS